MKIKTTLYLFLIMLGVLHSQQEDAFVWYDPLDVLDKIQGQGWENLSYARLPNKAENRVRKPVWRTSRQSAGLSIRFITNSESIAIGYIVNGGLNKPHMPSTGVSGVDLYIKKNDWLWCKGNYQFKDTIRYDYKISKKNKQENEFELYLPLYNSIKNLVIGVPDGSSFSILPIRTEKPIIVYGTSIAQGACASRPGMAWTNILSRKLNRPIINLAFSGNGRLEPELIELLTEIDAAVYILDCLPNLSPNEKRTKGEIQKRIKNSVLGLREKRPNATILLVEHAGYSDGLVNDNRKLVYETLNSWMSESFEILKSNGINNLFLLTKEDIGLSNDAFVDGTHPTDLGMLQYAEAYERALKSIQH
jgi:hypothetical protein